MKDIKINYDAETMNIIIYLLSKYKEKNDSPIKYELSYGSAYYLLNQTVRQLSLPKEKYLLSEAAKQLWDSLTSKEIENYFSRESIENEKIESITLPVYKGNKKESTGNVDVKKGKTFIFNNVFHCEHIIPINMIVKKLLELQNPTTDEVSAILDHISVCRVLKEEDRKIKEKLSRPFNENEVIEKIYLRNGIKIVGHKYMSSKKIC